MKKKIAPILILVLLFVIWLQPLSLGKEEVTIPDGVSAKEIAEHLSQAHIVRDVHEFLLWLRVSGREKYLKSGTYELYKYKNPLYVINELSRGGASDIDVTIPEGLTIYETADLLATQGLVERDRFVELCNDPDFIKTLGLNVPSLEGYLFPDTYSFSLTQTDSQIVTTFIRNFKQHTKKIHIGNPDSLHTILILASLVEKEARFEDERPVIARVFINRLDTNRPLESCATVLYALRRIDYEKYGGKTRLTEHDLKVKSPYNTYLQSGLPPGPICSPGAHSMHAVLNPADVDYLYFVAKGDGHHHFSRTYREHVAAKEKYND
jgi:UPF0755 protein